MFADVPSDPAHDRVLLPGKRIGAIVSSSTEQQLIDIYGRANVAQSKVFADKVSETPATVLFAGTDDELLITWQDSKRTQLKDIMVVGRNWRTPEDIGIGTSLSQLELINRRPIVLMGFDWSGSGMVVGWQGGELAYYEYHAWC